VTAEGPADAAQAYYEAFAAGDGETTSEYTHSDAPRQTVPGFVLSRYDDSNVSVEATETTDQSDRQATVDVTLSVDGSARTGPVELEQQGDSWRLWAGQEQPLLPAPQAVVFRHYDLLDRGKSDAALSLLHTDSPVSDIADTILDAYEGNDIRILGLETIEEGADSRVVDITLAGAAQSRERQTISMDVRTDGEEWRIWVEN